MNSWRDSYYVCFPLYSAARLEWTDVHHIADTSPCCVLQLQQKQRGNLLIRTESTVTTGETRRPDGGGLASHVPRESCRRRHSSCAGRPECIHLAAHSVCR